MSMKKLFVAISVIFVMSLAVVAYGQDKPETKKSDVKVEKVGECCQKSGSATCQSNDTKCKKDGAEECKGEHSEGDCKGSEHGSLECKVEHAKHEGAGPEVGSAECKVKHAKVEGVSQVHGECMKKTDKDGPDKK